MTWLVVVRKRHFIEGWGVHFVGLGPIFWRFSRADIANWIAPPRGSTIRVHKLRNHTPKSTQSMSPCREINLKES